MKIDLYTTFIILFLAKQIRVLIAQLEIACRCPASYCQSRAAPRVSCPRRSNLASLLTYLELIFYLTFYAFQLWLINRVPIV